MPNAIPVAPPVLCLATVIYEARNCAINSGAVKLLTVDVSGVSRNQQLYVK